MKKLMFIVVLVLLVGFSWGCVSIEDKIIKISEQFIESPESILEIQKNQSIKFHDSLHTSNVFNLDYLEDVRNDIIKFNALDEDIQIALINDNESFYGNPARKRKYDISGFEYFYLAFIKEHNKSTIKIEYLVKDEVIYLFSISSGFLGIDY